MSVRGEGPELVEGCFEPYEHKRNIHHEIQHLGRNK